MAGAEGILTFFSKFSSRMIDNGIPLHKWSRFYDKAISGKPEISEEYWLVRQTHPDAGIHIHVQMLAEVFEENTFNDLLKKSRRLVQKKGQTAQEFRQAYIAFWR